MIREVEDRNHELYQKRTIVIISRDSIGSMTIISSRFIISST